ncbi:hypothetical protein [Nocardioides luteus]|uniref:hypothetical protein n=1 Tax=Nocardioides luteus TaxID=1844 RepID=UPI00115F8937|nr:hypothetical protein [Nocardioides luteus]
MSGPAGPPPAEVGGSARRVLRTGWVAFALLPVAFVGAAILGDWLLSVQGYSSGEGDLPTAVVLRAGLPALLVLVAPSIAGAWCGHRAERLGHPGGRALFIVGTVVAAASVVLNLVQVIASWVLGL